MPFRLCNQNKKIKQFRTAQLRIHENKANEGAEGERTSGREGMLCSLSVEAAIALPVFLAAMCILMFPMKVIHAESRAQLELEQAAEYICAAEGVLQTVEKTVKTAGEEDSEEKTGEEDEAEDAVEQKEEKEKENGTKMTVSEFLTPLESGYSLLTALTAFDREVFELAVPTAIQSPTAEEPFAKINVLCTVRYPFTGLLGDRLQPIRLVTYRRAWVGRKGGAGRDWLQKASGRKEAEGSEDRIVYVARNSTKSGRYHVSADCHYISNKMTLVSKSSVTSLRNKEGEKYHACPSCQAGRYPDVYVFEHGNAFHSTPGCKANRSYAVEMKESEAIGKGLSPCTYCGRK